MWQYRGQSRPDFADIPGPGQESVWDYPRPPEMVPDGRLIEVYSGEHLIASSNRTFRVLETSHPPSFYLPPEDVKWGMLESALGNSECEWKGTAQYWSLAIDPNHRVVGWSYPDPTPLFEPLRDYVSFGCLLMTSKRFTDDCVIYAMT
jgi:uncharacterized protein (DUF427 family)